MKTISLWEDTKTFFPLFMDRLEKNFPSPGTICIVGASDGKFVLPLAKKGWRVTAIEINRISLYGGIVEFPKNYNINSIGLISRLKKENLDDYVTIVNDNFFSYKVDNHQAIFTSCSWHYSFNHNVPLITFIEKMQSVIKKDGIFCSEYMMPWEEKHNKIEHYIKEMELLIYFPKPQWEIMENFYTEVFEEKAHVGNLMDHKHRMGFFMSKKII